MVGLQELYISLIVVSSTCSGDIKWVGAAVNDSDIVIVDVFYPLVYWNIYSDVPSVLVIHVQWLSMNGMSDMLSKQIEKELILPFPL